VVVVVLIGGYWLYTYLGYASALKNEEERWLDQVFIPSNITGVVYEFNEPSGDICFSNLIIRQVNGEEFASGICACDENGSFRAFCFGWRFRSQGFRFDENFSKKRNGEQKDFDFPFCNN
jgi:hypothetical protein